MASTHDILIAGGGLNGTALALALAQSGFRVALIDPIVQDVRSDNEFDGRGYALALTSQRLLSAIGIWSRVAAHAQPILQIKVSDGRAGKGPAPFFLEFDHTEIEEGPMGFMIEDRFLRRALIQACDDHPNIDTIDGAALSSEQTGPAGISAVLSDGRQLYASLLIGCDGRKSGVATRAGFRRRVTDYGQTALVCAVEHELPHNGTAHQFFMPAGPLAILPLPGNQSSIVWAEKTETARLISRMDDTGFLDHLRPCFGDFLGEIRLAGKRFSYPLGLTVTDRFVTDRIALVGDAAHGMHPIAGQGLNAGLKDVAALAEVLTIAARRGEDIGASDVLERYQRWRRFDIQTLVAATDAFNRLFSNDNPTLRIARDLGMGLVNSMPFMRRIFIREAAGLTGELPKLLQGRVL